MKEVKFVANIERVVKFEKENGSLFKAFNNENMSIGIIMELAKCLLESEDMDLNGYLVENGFEKLVEELFEALKNAGFLPKSAKIEEK